MKERNITNEIQKRPKREINILVSGTIPNAGSFCFQLPRPNKDLWWFCSVEIDGYTLLIDRMGRKECYNQEEFGKNADVLIIINGNKAPIIVSPDCLIVDYDSTKSTRDECLKQIVNNYNEIEEAAQKATLFLSNLNKTTLPEIKSIIASMFFFNVKDNHKTHIFVPDPTSSGESCKK